MSWSVEYDSELGIIIGRYVGIVSDKDLQEATVKAVNLAKENKTNLFLIDASQHIGGTTTPGLYALPDLHGDLELDRMSSGALILPSTGGTAAEDARFFETVCLNNGWHVKVFSEHQQGVDWLMEIKRSNESDAEGGE